MGMFDWVIFEKGLLPEGLPEWVYEDGHEFQTKDLKNLMDTYVIHADGTLHSSSAWSKEVGVGAENIPYHGIFEVHDNNITYSSGKIVGVIGNSAQAIHVSLDVVFTHGKLEEIKVNGIEDVSGGRMVVTKHSFTTVIEKIEEEE